MSDAGQATDPLPPGVTLEDAEALAQEDPAAITAFVARFRKNWLQLRQREFVEFFVDLPDDAWLALRQALVSAKVKIREIDAAVRDRRLQLARAAGKDWRREACYRRAFELKVAGANFEMVRDALLSHENQEVAGWARDSGPLMLRRIYDSASPSRPLRLDEFVALMPTNKYIFKPTGDQWPADSVDARVPPCEVVDRDGNPILSAAGEPLLQSASSWLSSHEPVWAPGEPQIIRGKLLVESGWAPRPDAAAFNLYREPPPLPPGADPTKAGPWIDHVCKIYPDDADHIIKYNAYGVQHPDVKINHGILLGGSPGIGKDTLLAPIRFAVGPTNFAEISPQQAMGGFNGFLRSSVVRISEVKDMGEVDRYKFYEHMKTILAAPPETLRVNEKFIREYYVLNVCRIQMTTNHKTDGIYLPADDRRVYVAWSGATESDFVAGYWNELWSWYEREGFGHVAAYLRTLDVSDFNPKAPPLKTAAFWAIVGANHPERMRS
jgi:Family of unknown function (DUF5906)